jgi:hypothetical protein
MNNSNLQTIQGVVIQVSSIVLPTKGTVHFLTLMEEGRQYTTGPDGVYAAIFVEVVDNVPEEVSDLAIQLSLLKERTLVELTVDYDGEIPFGSDPNVSLHIPIRSLRLLEESRATYGKF